MLEEHNEPDPSPAHVPALHVELGQLPLGSVPFVALTQPVPELVVTLQTPQATLAHTLKPDWVCVQMPDAHVAPDVHAAPSKSLATH